MTNNSLKSLLYLNNHIRKMLYRIIFLKKIIMLTFHLKGCPQATTEFCARWGKLPFARKKTDVPTVIRDFPYHLKVLPCHQV
jgi:hypothetical protein